jgi:hypothetical protein
MDLAREAALRGTSDATMDAITQETKRRLKGIMTTCNAEIIRKGGYGYKSNNSRLLTRKELQNSNITNEMNGRKFADASFLFSLAGVHDEELFGLFEECIISELDRFGSRESCRSIDVLQIVERLAMSGLKGQSKAYHKAAALLRGKSVRDDKEKGEFESSIDKLGSGSYSLLEDRPLLNLWRHAARQRKSTNRNVSIPIHTNDLNSLFRDPTLPLYIDLGCGFGVMSLALSERVSNINTLGCDLSAAALSYCSGISRRWNLDDRCRFLSTDSLTCLETVLEQYQGPVCGVILNFPTPYHVSILEQLPGQDLAGESLKGMKDAKEGTVVGVIDSGSGSGSGNDQLPTSSDEFILTEKIVNKCRDVLTKPSLLSQQGAQSNILDGVKNPFLFVQSNVEDVALTMRDTVERSEGFGTHAHTHSHTHTYTHSYICMYLYM